MTRNDPSETSTLERMRSREPAGTVAVVPDTRAADSDGSIEIEIDSERRVKGVRVIDIGRLRTAERFERALIGAFQAADGERALRALTATGGADEWLASIGADSPAHSRLRVPVRPDVSLAAYRSGQLMKRSSNPQSRPAPGHSKNGHLTIQRGQAHELLSAKVDPEWISGAQEHHLEAAILEAAASAGVEG